MSITISVEMISYLRVVIQHLEFRKTLDDISNFFLVVHRLLVVGQMLVNTDGAVVTIRPAEFEQFPRNVSF